MGRASNTIQDEKNRKHRPVKPSSGMIRQSKQHPSLQILLGVIIFAAIMTLSLAFGALAGYQSGSAGQRATGTMFAKISLDEQYTFAAQDLKEGRYQLAYQRLEYIIAQDPSYPGATDLMAEAMAIIYATATPTAEPAVPTPTPTRDLRPVEVLFQSAQSFFVSQSWTEMIDTLAALRKADFTYQTARVDGMLFIALRMRGFDKIWRSGDLNGGIYDLALAGRFGPLDAQAHSARELARLYLIGSSFWEVDPAQAVQYFSQVAAAAPGLQDASGWTASARYREVLIQYGDKLAANREWCSAQQQYELAYSMGSDAILEEKAKNAALHCSPPTNTPEPTLDLTPTLSTPIPDTTTPEATFPVELTPTETTNIQPTPTESPPIIPPTDTPGQPINTPEPPAPSDVVRPPVPQLTEGP